MTMTRAVGFIHNNFYQPIIALIIVICCVLFSAPATADGCKPSSCPTNCSAQIDCNKKLDANCITEQNKKTEGGSCFNNVPVTAADSVSSQCSPSSGESGTNFPVSNFSDGNQAQVKAAAKGTVIFADVTPDGGRTVIIEHTKGCSDDARGDSGKYHTIYRHLFSINVSQGQEVEMNTVIGLVGGSTATSGKTICDNKAQSGLEGYDSSGCSSTAPTDIHLNFEVVDGPASGSGTVASGSAGLNSNCSAIQNYCGGCSSNLNDCESANPTAYREISTSSVTVTHKTANNSSAKASCESGLDLDPEKCVFCGLFKDIYNAASTIAKIANDGLAKPTKTLVGIGFLIWLAIFILRNITSFGAIKPSEMIKGILFQGFRVTVVMLILGGAIYQVMDLTINPILQTGLSFSRSISASSSTCDADAEYLQGIVGYDSTKGIQATSEGGLSTQVGVAFVCSIKKLEDSVSKLMSYGHYSTCLSFRDFPALGIIPHAGFLTTGAFLFIVGAILLISFPWFLIDCLLQLCITVALLPCAIGAFAFKITSKYLKNLWGYFMNAMFNFVFIAIVIFIITANFKGWLGYDFDAENIDPNIFINATGNGLAWWGTSAFRILGVCFFCFMFLQEAKSMADKFASAPSLGGGKGIGVMMGGLAASGGLSLGKTGLSTAGSLIGSAGESLGEGATSLFGSNVDSRTNQAKGILLGLTGGEKIKDGDGNVVGYTNSFKIRGKEYKMSYTKDDKGVWSSSFQKGNIEKIDDTILTAELTRNDRGEIVGIKTEAKNVSSKYLINSDGTINTNSVQQLMSNSNNKELAARHIVSTVMKDRGMELDDTFLNSKTKINEDGTVTITQKNEDGKIQTVNAGIDATTGRMTITSEIADADGQSNITTSDGINKRTSTRKSQSLNTNSDTGVQSGKGKTPDNMRPQKHEDDRKENNNRDNDKDKASGSTQENESKSKTDKATAIPQRYMDKITQLLHSGKISESDLQLILDRIDEGMSDTEIETLLKEYE